jgi:plastocyanin
VIAIMRPGFTLAVVAGAALGGIVLVSGAAPLVKSPAAQAENAGQEPRLRSGVDVRRFRFQPIQLTVKAGTEVTWTNGDDIDHTVTSGAPEKKDGRFDWKLNGKEATASITFTEPGTYKYFCDRHHSMTGTIRVK